jgi:hypothetical protein
MIFRIEEEKKMKRFAMFALCGALLLLATGCNTDLGGPPSDPAKVNAWIAKNKATITQIVNMAAELGTSKGLKAWAKKNPAGAKEAALALAKNISDQILPYFKDQTKLMTAAEVQQLLSSTVFKNVPDEVKLAIIAASAVLDFYLPVPSSGTYLTQDQRDIVCAFFEGVRTGCDDFTTPEAVPATKNIGGKARAMPKASWLE